MDQSLSDFQSDTGSAAHTTLDTEQLISCIRTALIYVIASLKDSDGAVIPVHKVLELLTKIHDILDNTLHGL